MTPEEFMEIRSRNLAAIRDLEEETEQALRAAWHLPMPANVRPAVIADCVIDTVIWFTDASPKWVIVEGNNFRRNGEWSCFTDIFGNDYGLDNAYVEVGKVAPVKKVEPFEPRTPDDEDEDLYDWMEE